MAAATSLALVRPGRTVHGHLTKEHILTAYRRAFYGDVFLNTALPDEGALAISFAYAHNNKFMTPDQLAQKMLNIVNEVDQGMGTALAGRGWLGDPDSFNGNKRFYIVFNAEVIHDRARTRGIDLKQAAIDELMNPRFYGRALMEGAEAIGAWHTKTVIKPQISGEPTIGPWI